MELSRQQTRDQRYIILDILYIKRNVWQVILICFYDFNDP